MAMPRNALVKKAAFIFSNFENRTSEVLARKNAITCLKEELAFVHVQNPFVLKPDEANDFFHPAIRSTATTPRVVKMATSNTTAFVPK